MLELVFIIYTGQVKLLRTVILFEISFVTSIGVFGINLIRFYVHTFLYSTTLLRGFTAHSQPKSNGHRDRWWEWGGVS